MLESVDSPSPARHLRDQFASELNKIIVVISSSFIARGHRDPEWRSNPFEALVLFSDENDLCAFDEILRLPYSSTAVSDAFFALFVSILKGRLNHLAADFFLLSQRSPDVGKANSLGDLGDQFNSILPGAELIFSEWAERTQIPYLYRGSSVKSAHLASIQEVLNLAFAHYIDRRAFANTQRQPDGTTESSIGAEPSSSGAEPMTRSEGVGSRPKTRALKSIETARRDQELRAQAEKLKTRELSWTKLSKELAKTDPGRGMKAVTIRRIILSPVR